MTDAEIDVLVAKLEAAGLVETHRRADGKIAYRLTRTGDQLGWLMAMGGEEEAGVVLDALLSAGDAFGRGRIARGAAQVPHPPR
jgi:hypothetical protein